MQVKKIRVINIKGKLKFRQILPNNLYSDYRVPDGFLMGVDVEAGIPKSGVPSSFPRPNSSLITSP